LMHGDPQCLNLAHYCIVYWVRLSENHSRGPITVVSYTPA